MFRDSRNNFRGNNASRSFGGFNRSSRGRGGFRRGRSNGVIDENMYIKSAVVKPAEEEYIPKVTFNELDINNTIKENIIKKGFKSPTPIQDLVIPEILTGNDVVGIANTGTGKTGAFLIPLIDKVLKTNGTKILILVPTRELAVQINDELYTLTRNLRVYSVECIGGSSISRQINDIRRGFNFIIGTPGRVNDLIERRILNLGVFNTVVLDEVDRMLDMGFIDDIKQLISFLPKERQSLFFSATLDPKVESIMNMLLKREFKKISVKTGITADNVNQNVVKYTDKSEKVTKLTEILKQEEVTKTLIFVNTKRGVEELSFHLERYEFRAEVIHGDKRQMQRQRALDNFKYGKAKILIATDVAARGIDVSDISHVINFDVPESFEDYIHRIGRTGRANKFGNALTFIPQHSVSSNSSGSSYGRGNRRFSRY